MGYMYLVFAGWFHMTVEGVQVLVDWDQLELHQVPYLAPAIPAVNWAFI